MLKPTKILAPTDFSKHADKAIREAFELAKEYKAEIYVLHVVDEKIEVSRMTTPIFQFLILL